MKPSLIGGALLIACTGAWAHDCECTCKCPELSSEAKPEPKKSWRERGAYAGGSLTYTRFDQWSFAGGDGDDGSYSRASRDDSDLGFRVHAGMNVIPAFDIEVGYGDYGSAVFSAQSDGNGPLWNAGPVRESLSAEGWDFSLIGRLKLGSDWGVHGRLGILKWNSDHSLSGDAQSLGAFELSDSGDVESMLYGAGVDYDGLRPLRFTLSHARAELEVEEGSLPSGDATLGTTTLAVSHLFQ